MDDIKPGQVVRSLAGRDKGHFFVVMGILDPYHVAICDGDLRKITVPKKKKIKHLAKTNTVDAVLSQKLLHGDKVSNADLRAVLSSFNETEAQGREEV